MKLYTKQGDDGRTGLIGGGRVGKDDARIIALGHVDETNAAIGLVLSACGEDRPASSVRGDEALASILRQVQSDLFALGGQLATPADATPPCRVGPDQIRALERWIDEASEAGAALKNFVLPGGGEVASRLHLARAVCRRAERAVAALSADQAAGADPLVYLNRLGDLLFALARQSNHRAGIADVVWPGSQSTA